MRSKNKFIYAICIFTTIFCMCMQTSYATTKGTVSLQTDNSMIEAGEEVEVFLHIEGNQTAAFTAYLTFDETKIEYVSGPENVSVVENRIIFVWYDETGGEKAKEGALSSFRFRAKENGIANFTVTGEFYTKTGQLIQTDFEELQVQIGKEETKLEKEAKEEMGTDTKADNAMLSVLRLDREGLVPSFEKDVLEYYMTISSDVNSLEVLAVPENPNATVEVTGNTGLKDGLNVITIKVISEDQTVEKVYTIQVTKTANLLLANANLEILAIENVLLNPPFDPNVTHYQIEVANTVNTLNILAIPENENATVTRSGNENLKEGDQIVAITVTAPNGISKREYIVNVHKRNSSEEETYVQNQIEGQKQLEEIYQLQQASYEKEGIAADTTQGEEKVQKRFKCMALGCGKYICDCFGLFLGKANKKT